VQPIGCTCARGRTSRPAWDFREIAAARRVLLGDGMTTTPSKNGNGESKGGKRRALLVGINDYPGFASDLPSCTQDVAAMGDLLSRSYGYELTTLVDTDASLANVRDAIAELCSDVTEADRVVYYYSGHGTTIPRVDAVEECLVLADGSLLPDDDFVKAFAPLPAGTGLVILDSCFSGGMAKLFGTYKRIELLTQQARAATKSARYKPFGSRPRPTFGGLATLRKKQLVEDEANDLVLNALLVSAASEGELASASTDATNGLSAFTYAILTTLANDGAASTAELVVQATAELRSIGILQTPQIKEPGDPPGLADRTFPLLQTSKVLTMRRRAPRRASR
jgi:hypothetical protein